ncbi:MAG TPA: hypothetical protein VKP30_03095 [Polyangiaceae bacterium]|nr:hypothetical protein [Polyangiaceae bacterium]
MQKIAFFGLERSIQDRFVESTHGREVPNPLLYQKAPQNPVARTLLIVLFAALGAGAVFAWLGFGNLAHPWAITPAWSLAVYCGLACVALLALLRAIVIWDRDASLPYLRGRFVYPVGVIDACGETILIHEFTDLAEHAIVGNRLQLRFKDGHRFEFHNRDKSRLEQVQACIPGAQQRLSLAPGSGNQRDLVLLNPLLDTGFRNPFAPVKPLVKAGPGWGRYWFLIAVAVGLPLGFGICTLRNVLSEKQMYVKARKHDSSSAYRNYLARGGKRADVVDLLLPRAELREARAQKHSAALETYLVAHPNSKIKAEIEAALRAQLLTELEKARDQNSMSALREFRESSKRIDLVKEELQDAEKALFQRALAKYLSTTPASAEQRAFFTRLLEFARTRGSKLEVRFHRQLPADAVERAEVQLKKSAYYVGVPALPSQYFAGKYAEPREAVVVDALRVNIEKLFPKDMITLEVGPAIEGESAPPPNVTVPTILITHRTELSGVFLSKKPRGSFVGLSIQYKARFMIPGDAAPLEFQYAAWVAPGPKKFEEAGLAYKNFYEMMATDGFNRFLKRYLAALFGAPVP